MLHHSQTPPSGTGADRRTSVQADVKLLRREKERLGDCTKNHVISTWAERLAMDEVIRVRLCYSKHQRHRVAHEVIAGPGYKRMSFVLWLKLILKLPLGRKEMIPVNSPLLVHVAIGQLVPMTGSFMSQMDKAYAPIMGWY